MRVCMIVPNRMVQGGIASVTNGYRDDKYFNEQIKVNYIESYVNGNKLKKMFKAFHAYVSFIFTILFFKPEIVHIHSSFGPSFYRKKIFINIAHFHRIKIINHIHGADFDKFYVNADNKKKEKIKKTYNKCDVLIALSEEWKAKLSNIVDEKKIFVLQNYCVIKDGINRESNKNYTVLFLGEIGERKGCFDIPAIISEVKEQIPTVKFIIAGKGTKDAESKFYNLLCKYDVKDCVSMPGWIRNEEKDYTLTYSDLFLLPSYNEGMPMSILDAMGYGLPIVSTDVGGIPQIVINDFNGYTCKPGDISNMSKQIIEILENNELYKNMSKNCYSFAKEKYSLENHVKKLISLYESVESLQKK